MGKHQAGKYRYKMEIPLLDYNPRGFVDVNCSPDDADWQSLTWGRFGSGGSYDARHCFVDDWRIEHLWRRQGQGLAKAICHGVMTAPDFTIEGNYPFPVAMYQVWRSRVLSRYWQDNGVTVVPVLQWGSENIFSICARGIDKGSVVAVRGPQKGTEKEWLKGAGYMKHVIQPSLVLHFGRKIDFWGDVIFIPLHSRKNKNSCALNA